MKSRVTNKVFVAGKAMTSQLEGRPGVKLLGQHGMGGDHICEVLVRPGLYREMDDLVQRFGKGKCTSVTTAVDVLPCGGATLPCLG